MISLLIGGGAALAAVAWLLVARGRLSVWPVMSALYGALGVVSAATGRLVWTREVEALPAALLGLGVGLGLWGATIGFVALVSRWPAFDRHVSAVYDQRGDVSLGAALALAALVVSPGEEAFWRGVVQNHALPDGSPVAGAVFAWAGYVAVNLASLRLPIIAGAVVAGGVWGWLAWWSGGILTSLACHVVWTGLMVARPPRQARR